MTPPKRSPRPRKRSTSKAAAQTTPAERANVPAVIRPRTPEEEALVAAHANRPRLECPVQFEADEKGQIRLSAADKDLARARLARTFHAGGDYLLTVIGRTGAALGIDDTVHAVETAVGIVHGIDPQDHLEALLASQMAATHIAALAMVGRVNAQDGVAQITTCVNAATRLMRTFTAQVAALKDYRSKGHQTVTVQHVDVREGGQAIVGDVTLNGAQRGST